MVKRLMLCALVGSFLLAGSTARVQGQATAGRAGAKLRMAPAAKKGHKGGKKGHKGGKKGKKGGMGGGMTPTPK